MFELRLPDGVVVRVDESDQLPVTDPRVPGYVMAELVGDDQLRLTTVARRGLPADERADLTDWLVTMIEQLRDDLDARQWTRLGRGAWSATAPRRIELSA